MNSNSCKKCLRAQELKEEKVWLPPQCAQVNFYLSPLAGLPPLPSLFNLSPNKVAFKVAPSVSAPPSKAECAAAAAAAAKNKTESREECKDSDSSDSEIQQWIQCDNICCRKWRLLEEGMDVDPSRFWHH